MTQSVLFFLSAALVMSLSGCVIKKAKAPTGSISRVPPALKNVTASGPETNPLDDPRLEELKKNDLKYKTFSLRGKGQARTKDQKINFHLRLSGIKDSCIVGALSVMGIEGARFKITRDSVWIVKRLEKEYQVLPAQRATEVLGFTAGLTHLEGLLLGNSTVLNQPGTLLVCPSPDHIREFSLKDPTGERRVDTWTTGKRITRLRFETINPGRNSLIALSGFKTVIHQDSIPAPHHLEIQSSEGGEQSFSGYLEINHLEINPPDEKLHLSFTIPPSYIRIVDR